VQPRASAPLGEVGGGVVLSVEDPLGGQQPLHAHRAAGVDAGGGDAHLGAKAEPEAVREPRAGVVEHTGAVHAAQELLGRRICKWKLGKVWESVENLETAQAAEPARTEKVLNKINFPNDLNLLWQSEGHEDGNGDRAVLANACMQKFARQTCRT